MNRHLKKFLNTLFSVKNNARKSHKIVRIAGIKIKIRVDRQQEELPVCDTNEDIVQEVNYESIIYNLLHDRQWQLRIQHPLGDYRRDILDKLQLITSPPHYLEADRKHNHLHVLLGCDELIAPAPIELADLYVQWEIRPTRNAIDILSHALMVNKEVIFVGDSFLRSITPYSSDSSDGKYKRGISFTLDDLTSYFDATRSSRLEQLLNYHTLILSSEQRARARHCIAQIISNHLTKYNHQPIFTPEIGRKGVKKVLVVDQAYGDMSILKGNADDATFHRMLQAAIDENPDADIIVKTHPDAIEFKSQGLTHRQLGYYLDTEPRDNIYLQTEPINPISLIQYADKVYVCTTQFGFEALMCGKEVHVFGLPFYAGWGLTHDRQSCTRRTQPRDLEELFYITYIIYSHYVHPGKGTSCEIEQAMEYLLELRDEYQQFLAAQEELAAAAQEEGGAAT